MFSRVEGNMFMDICARSQWLTLGVIPLVLESQVHAAMSSFLFAGTFPTELSPYLCILIFTINFITTFALPNDQHCGFISHILSIINNYKNFKFILWGMDCETILAANMIFLITKWKPGFYGIALLEVHFGHSHTTPNMSNLM